MIAEIIPKLFLSSQLEASNVELLQKLGIESTISVASDLDVAVFHPFLKRYSLHSLLDDDTNSLMKYQDVLHSIAQSHQVEQWSTLVHCKAGASRSPSMIAYYLFVSQLPHKFKSPDDAMQHVIDAYDCPAGPGAMKFSPVWRQLKKMIG